MSRFSWSRTFAVFLKELRQMRRDRLTFAMMVVVPIVQLILFGYAINTDPRHLPLAVVEFDHGPVTRDFVQGLENSRYFRVAAHPAGTAEGTRLLETGEVQFLLVVPAGFERRLLRGERPALLLAADATDPAAAGNALAALAGVTQQTLGRMARADGAPPAFEVRVQRRYNPEGLSRYNIVPGLIGVILTMTMVMQTALAVTRETERGTMENLLATPVRPIEVMVGKIAPYIVVGYVQVMVILLLGRLLVQVPMVGSLALLSTALTLFIAANLAVGFTFSTLARNQLQAVQLTFFFFLPSMLLSGFMFPFRGMPAWAQQIGQVLPLTHFLRVVRGILLKGNGGADVLPELWPIALFMLGAGAVAVARYRRTLD
jgi:ABC-2 type transport system permease protein